MKFFLALMLCASTIASAQILPGGNAFAVQFDARTLSTGVKLPPSALVVERPEANTYVPGVVIVKTRATYGTRMNERSIEGSSLNSTLNSVSVSNISSTYPVTDNTTDADAQLASEIGLDRIYTVRYSDATDAFDLCLQLMKSPDVEYAVPMLLHKTNVVPNDPQYAQQTWMKTMKMEAAWDITKGSENVIIAIVDSGTDWTHEDLADKIKINTGEIAGNGIDDDKNGYVDDVRGWDFVGNVTAQEAYAGTLRPDNDPKVSYPTINGTNGHGTLTGGCAAASTNNSKGVASTGWLCKILPIKVGSDNPNVGGLLAGYAGVKYAADMGAQIINCSWGGTTGDPSGQDLVNYCIAKGALIVAASGNSGMFTEDTPHYPSSFAGVLSVGSSSATDRPSSFSNYGYDVVTYAPGEYILSTFPGNQYQGFPGTSFSCPLVAGICGLIKAKHPDWTPMMIIQQIRSTSDALSGVSVADRPKYFGRANGQNALKYNSSFTSGDRIPGIDIASISVAGSGVISSYDPTSVSVVLKNYLSDATDVRITVAAIDNGVTINGNSNTVIPSIAHDASVELPLTIQLQNTYPWYENTMQLMLTIQSGAYLNYVMVRIPVRLPSSNRHTLTSSSDYITFNLVDFTTNGALWATGTMYGQGAVFVGSQSGISNVMAAPLSPTTICGLNGTSALIGGVLQGKATIALTRNASAWTTTDVSKSMSTVAGIGMMDDNLGFAVGNAVSGKFGTMKTTDGGNSWQLVSNALVVNSGETVLPQCLHADARGFWFATSSRRIVYTLSKGASWLSSILAVPNATITSIAFDENNNGALIYTENGTSWVALSEAGGAWKPRAVDLTALDIKAAAVASPGKHLLLIGTNGEVFGSDNAGKNWQTVLSQPAGATKHAVARNAGSTVLATVGDNLGTLAYKYSGPNGTRILSVASDSVDYGSLEQNQNRLRTIKIESTGESDVSITGTNLVMEGTTPVGAFKIVNELDGTIPAGGSDNIGIRLYATDTGTYRATLTVLSNATTGGTITVHLKGVISPATGVHEVEVAGSISVYPNPTHESSTIVLPQTASAYLYSTTGSLMKTYGVIEAGLQRLSTADVAPGAYILRVEMGGNTYSVPLVRMP